MEFNSQICTSRKQSERLLALGLKKETADMSWSDLSEYPISHPYKRIRHLASDLEDKVCPAWSLHRLIEILHVWYLDLNFHNFPNAYEQVIAYFEAQVKGGFIKKNIWRNNMEIKEKTIYIVGNTRFDNYADAAKYSDICDDINKLMSCLKPRTKNVEDGLEYVSHNIVTVNSVFTRFIGICKLVFPQFADKFYKRDCTINKIYVEMILSDARGDYPILWDAMRRFNCIDREGREFQQPYYAKHPVEGIRDIEERRKQLDLNMK